MKIEYKVIQFLDNTFFVNFESQYDMSMTMLRCQEFYESESTKFRGKKFSLFEFMRFYSHKHGKGSFTYTTDWTGFNFPGQVIRDCIYKIGIDDKNFYDETLENIYQKHIKPKLGKNSDFYVIASVGSDNKSALRHEIAHAMFYLNYDYRKQMQKLVKNMSKEDKDKMFTDLKQMGYAKKVWVDETQAYLSTDKKGSKATPFRQTFEEFYKKLEKR